MDLIECPFLRGTPFTFEDVTAEAGDLSRASFADMADIDRDGWRDLLLSETNTINGISLLRSDEGTFFDHPELLVEIDEVLGEPFISQVRAHFVDFDGDGDLDIYSERYALENLGLPDRKALEVGE